MAESRPDVVIAGAGPAGIATAVALVRLDAGLARRVVCLDRARFPRRKPCGGGLTGNARAALEALGLELRVPRATCPAGEIVYGDLRRVVPLEPAGVDVVRREALDADLLAQARDLGIEVREGQGLASFEVDARAAQVRVATSSGATFRARVLVGADGPGSRVRRALASEQVFAQGAVGAVVRPAAEAPLRLMKAEVASPSSGGPGTMVYDFTPMREGLRGYVWLFPMPDGRLNVGLLHTPAPVSVRRPEPSSAALRDILARTLGRHRVRLDAPLAPWPAWRYLPGRAIAGPHLLCVGDAAGIDPLTGEGIAVALEQGPLAAAAITRALATGDFGFRNYGATVRAATVGRELALDCLFARLLYEAPGASLWLSLILFDEATQRLYARRISGATVLADEKPALVAAAARHLVRAPARLLRLAAAGAGSVGAGCVPTR